MMHGLQQGRCWMRLRFGSSTRVQARPAGDTARRGVDVSASSQSSAVDEPGIGHAPPCAHHYGPPVGVASERTLDHEVQDPPRTYGPPDGDTPHIDATTALARAAATSAFSTIGNPVDAALATMRSGATTPTLVWILTVTDIEAAPSLGPPVCTDTAAVVDATTGQLLLGLTGTSFR